MSDASMGALIVVSVTSMFTLLTTLATFMMNWVMKAREREWQIEDRLLAKAMADQVQTVHGVAVEGVVQAKAAYEEANTVNLKIQRLHEEMAVVMKLAAAQAGPAPSETPTIRAGGDQ